ncbi:MAG: hypothetical protein FJ279_17780 [Planctomycetes bacterium]|nr:hypothetical protein [Planctomycetota bacterium]
MEQLGTGGNAFLQKRPFVQIPGPNPILTSGLKGAWDEQCIEACDAVKDFETYYLFYHGVPKDKARWGDVAYQIGLATAKHPLGPWQKFGDGPVLTVGPKGSWDDRTVACAAFLREKPDRYLMFYSGCRKDTPCSIGLATAPKLEGPWTKCEKNPIIPNFGYVGGIVKFKGKYHLYTTHPIGSTAPDYAPFCLALADAPEGPWQPWSGNPVIREGEKNVWDDGGYSEAKVTFWDGVFHAFYGGAKEYVPRRETRESIGYAYSFDGFNFIKYGGNPVAAREADPNMAAFAEVHTLFEPPFIYAYHTIRYVDPKLAPGASGGTSVFEDLGVQVLVTDAPFRLPMPVLTRDSLAAGEATQLSDCPSVSLNGVSEVSLTAECEYDPEARQGIRVHVRLSPDGLSYDTADALAFDNHFRPGTSCRRTVALRALGRSLKVFVENLDDSSMCRKTAVTAALAS